MKNLLKLLRFLLICLPGFSLFPLHAQDTFGSGVNEFTIDFVEVGDAGNPDDSGTTGLYHSTSGGVAYVYRMGTYEISRDMITKANALGNLNITMSNFGSSASDRPAGGIIWNEAARFVNWLNTSKGYPVAYKFATQPGDVGYSANENVEIWTSSDAGYDADNPYRNANALYVLPSEDEWYKAAYYSGTGNVYNDYAVGDDTIPAGVSGGVDSGSAVYVQGATSGPAAITNAGGLSDYGVMGMNGNVWEWTEITSDDVAFRGGHWYSQEANLRSSQRIVSAVGGGDDASRGFRVASRTPLVLPADQTLTFAAIADQTTTDTVTLAATASSGLPVSYAVTGPASLSGSNLSFTGAGTVQVTASQAGDDDWNAAPAVVRSFEVTKAVAQVYFEDLYQIYDGNPKSVTAYTEPWGLTLEITYDSSSTSPSAAGSYAVVATIVDDTYQGSETETFQILPLVEGSDVLESVLVGNPGNSNDSTGFGAVSYEYYISTYEVTNAQYAAFLNAVAETDTYSLYTSWDLLYGGIARSGSDGSYSYATTRPNAPVNYITFWAAARYVNWLTNGRPTGPQGPGTTETGMYNLGGVDFPVNNTVTRDATAWANGGVAIANENEWYKAAYYDPGLNSGAGGYWLYPTQSNTLPTAAAPNASDANSANHDNFVGNVTDVGGYTLAASAYGTYNQAGNVEEWIEDIDVSGNARIFRGGRFSYANGLDATSASYATPETYGPVLGFRVTSLRPLSDVPGLVVTTLADTIDAGDGQTSLREAIAYAATLSGAQTITFSDNTDDGAVDFHDGTARTITLGGTQLTLSSDLNIEGPGASLLSVSADNSSRVFQVDTDTEVTFTGFTVRDGEVAEDGGGILNGGDLTLLEMIITENESTVYFNGAGVYNLTGATLTIRRSLFSDNSATSDGGGFFNNNGTVLVENSTFSGNHAGGFGGAFVTSGDLGVVDVTVVYSTFTGNNSDVGPGGFHAPASGTVNITASIVAGNTGSGPNDVDVNGGAQSGGHNLIGVQGNSSGWVATDQVGSQSTPLDPVLGPLQDNGGPTSTHALLAGSPALFAAAAVEGVTTDQRGVARPQAIAADVGAYEAEPTVTVTLSNLTQTFDGNPKSATVVTDPVGVNVEVTYDGSSTAPTSSGSYSVRAIVDEPGQIGGVIGTLAISKGSQAITFSAIADQSTADTVTLAATASSGLPVSYAVTGPATLSGSNLSFTGAGTVQVTASQAGSGNWDAASAVVRSFEVSKAVATVTLSGLNQSFDGSAKSVTATTDPAGLTVGITYDGSSTAPSSAGSYAVVATINDTLYQGSASGTLEISSANQSITFAAIADQTTTDTVTLAATASSGLPVSYAVTGPASLSGSDLTFTGAGTVQVTASQAGNDDWDAASAVQRSFEVSKAVATVTLNALNQSFDGSAKSVTATTDPAGLTVGITYDGSSTAPSSAGSYAVVATINDTLYQGSASGTLEISSANQSITFAAIADQTTTDTVTLAATASSGLPVSYAVTGPASLSGSNLTFTGAGTVQVTASQAGDDDWDAASAVQRSFEVSKAVATVTLSGLNQSFDGTAKSVTATTDPTGLTVDITYDGSSTAPSAAGSYAVVATINDTLYQGSASGTLEISSANQSITFAAIADQTTTDTVTLAATASSGLPVSYAVTGPASLSGSDLTFTGAGTVQVTASQAGDDDWDAASAVARSFEVSKAVATVTLNGLNQSFDGSAKSVTATTVPAGLTVDITYDGSSIAPSAAGSYAVVATINDTLYQGSASGSLEISTANQSITFAAIADQSTTATVTLAATASSGLPVSYAVTGPASLSGSDLTFSGAGTVQVTASQAGNTNWNAATPVVRSFEVTVVNAEITGLSPNRANIGGGIEVVISGNNLGDGSDITGVLLAGVSATILTQTSDSVTVFVNAAETAGVGDVKVTSTSKGEVTLVDGFEYLWLASPEQLEPTDITASSLVAHWTLVPGADTHVLDVGTDQNFDTYVTGFEKLDVAQTTQQVIPDLSAGAWYAIRVFASNAQGLSLPSRTVWVPAGDNIPYVLNPPPSGPVSLGSVLTFNPIYMFHGSGMVYSTISSAPTVVDASINEEGLLRLEMLQPGTAMITVTATDPVTHYSSSYTFNVEVLNAMPVVESNTFAERESWNIRFTQKVSLRNNSGADALGVRVLFSDLAPGITIENQTGASEDGRPVLEVSTAFADGEALSFNIVYLATTVSPEVQPPTLAFEYILKDFVPPLPGEGVEVTRIQPIGDGTDRIVIEFETQPGALYAVEYMNDFPDGDWVEVPLRLRAGANKTQWIDSGPPVTQPSSGMRVYRVKQLIEGEE